MPGEAKLRSEQAISPDRRRLLVAGLATVVLHGGLALLAVLLPAQASEAPATPRPKPVSARFLPAPKPAEPVVQANPPRQPDPPPAESAKVQVPPPPGARRPVASKRNPPSLRGKTLVAKASAAGAQPAAVADGSGSPAAVGGTEADSGGPVGGPAGDVPGPAAEPAVPPPEPPPPQVEPAREVLVPPEPLQRPVGRYPPGLLRPDTPVRVVLIVEVSATGQAISARVTASAGAELDEEAIRVAKSITFRPATRGGRPVALSIPWVVTFR